jgi:hypothetical protein
MPAARAESLFIRSMGPGLYRNRSALNYQGPILKGSCAARASARDVLHD